MTTPKETSPPTPPIEAAADPLPDFYEGEPGHIPPINQVEIEIPENREDEIRVAVDHDDGPITVPFVPEPHLVHDPLPSFEEGPRVSPPHLVHPREKEGEKGRDARAMFWVSQIQGQNSKSPEGVLWVQAQREYSVCRVGPVGNWPRKVAAQVERRFFRLLEDPEFLRPIIHFHLSISNTPQLMSMTIYSNHAAAMEALRLVIVEYYDE